MSPERTQAYGRVLRTLEDLGPSKLQPSEQTRIRDAADCLVLCGDELPDAAAREALSDADELLRSLVESGRWEEVTAERLRRDLRDCGPAGLPTLRAA